MEKIDSRLDSVVFRFRFTNNRRHARQRVSHALLKINGNMVNIPSYLVGVVNILSIDKQYLDKHASLIFSARSSSEACVGKLDDYTCKVFNMPVVNDILFFSPKLVVEFLSRLGLNIS